MARRILLADDSVTAQNMGRRILSDAGYEVVTVNNGSAALKKIAEQKPDLIVLDVYMPGYGGLEVCQRVKENRETARIPVLLTVGKLEPFKPEEARRVRADAFIIKPFEASELLTALTKLEDKIVPQGLQKPGRFAKALAAVEQSGSESGESFGDMQTGWKNRLTIPPPSAKPAEPPTVPSQGTSAVIPGWGSSQESKPVEPKPDLESPLRAGFPPDITPEEIAAITAAAASFEGKLREAAPETQAIAKNEAAESRSAVSSAASDEAPGELVAATFASTQLTDMAGAEIKPNPTEVAFASETAGVEAAKTDELPKSQESVPTDSPGLPANANSGETSSTEPVAALAEKSWTSDVEVMAAIASLAPGNGHVEAGVSPDIEGMTIGAAQGAASATMPVLERAGGPRWIAEAIPVPEDESTLILQQEMEKAYAAFAAADAGRAILGTAVASVSSEENVGKQAESEATVSSANESSAAAVVAPSDSGSAMLGSTIGVAYAAAAGTSTTGDSSQAGEAIGRATAALPAEITGPVPDAGEKRREAELAAAWQNWKQIRESIVGSQLTTQIADAAAAELKEGRAEATAAEEDASVAETEESTGVAESSAIASIVDSVLAELKPKLMEEIVKKMNTDKKEKEKKKKK